MPGRQRTVAIVVHVTRQGDLFEAIAAIHTRRRTANLLNRSEQKTDRHADDGDYDQ